jgi:hypothetical protein
MAGDDDEFVNARGEQMIGAAFNESLASEHEQLFELAHAPRFACRKKNG